MVDGRQPGGAQTLSRGLAALEAIAGAKRPLTVSDVSGALNLPRSNVYRILRTLEDHGFVVRDSAGAFELGPKISALARNVSHDLQTVAQPELTALARELEMTAFLATVDADRSASVTVASAAPKHAVHAVSEPPGSRHPLDRGAAGRAILTLLDDSNEPEEFVTSYGELVPGLSSIAVPLAIEGQQPSALAVVYLGQPVHADAIGPRLLRAAEAIRSALS